MARAAWESRQAAKRSAAAEKDSTKQSALLSIVSEYYCGLINDAKLDLGGYTTSPPLTTRALRAAAITLGLSGAALGGWTGLRAAIIGSTLLEASRPCFVFMFWFWFCLFCYCFEYEDRGCTCIPFGALSGGPWPNNQQPKSLNPTSYNITRVHTSYKYKTGAGLLLPHPLPLAARVREEAGQGPPSGPGYARGCGQAGCGGPPQLDRLGDAQAAGTGEGNGRNWELGLQFWDLRPWAFGIASRLC